MQDIYLWNSPIGTLKLSAEDEHLTGVSFLQKDMNQISVIQNSVSHSDLLYEAYTQLQEYFAGKRTQFELPIHNEGTAFQRRVWQELRRIPYGETRSYQDLATAIGNPKACRAVGQANNKNPLLIINPCHRAIHKNGDITGFACGTDMKQFLLDLETQVLG